MACVLKNTTILMSGLGHNSITPLITKSNRQYSAAFARHHQLLKINRITSSAYLITKQSSNKLPLHNLSTVRNIFSARPDYVCHQHLRQLATQFHPSPTSTHLTPTIITQFHNSREFYSGPATNQQQKDSSSHPKTEKVEKPTFGEQMSLRLINENGFLSWTRNSYLSAAVGATMLNGANIELAHHAGVLVLLVSAMNMAWGSGCHFTNLIRLRDRIAMSRPKLFLNLLGTVIHALLWLCTLAFYIHRTRMEFDHDHHKGQSRKHCPKDISEEE